MIGKLKGIVDTYGEDFVILDVGGVGYQVHCSARTLQALPAPGEAATLSIETYVREDQIKLFGFASDVEREWFRLLQTVQGVGAKVALSVLGTLQVGRSRHPRSPCATRRRLRARPASGAKVAERIVTELKDKAPAFANVDPAVVHLAGALDEKRAPQPVMDAVSALVNLGYGQPQAAAAIAAAARNAGEGADTATLIRQGLEGTGEMNTPRRLVDRRSAATTTRTPRCGRSGSAEFIGQEKARANLGRLHRGGSARARKRSTMCCSSARRAWARPRWRRSWRANWASISAPPPAR